MATALTTGLPEANPIIAEDLERIASAELPWPQLQGKTVMVTGGGGFLASYLVKALLCAGRRHRLGLRVICVLRRPPQQAQRLAALLDAPDLDFVVHDIAQALPTDFPQADLLVHAASQASPKFYGVDPVGTLLANSSGTAHLLDHAVRCAAERVLFFSSGEVYGVQADPDRTIDELAYGYLDPMQVRACYGESKRLGETMCVSWGQQYGLHTNVVRPFHTYGPGIALDDGRVFADFVADVVHSRDIVLKSDGLARRPFCYIADATLAFLTVLLKGERGEAYNVGNPEAEISMRDLAGTLAGLFPERGSKVRFDIQDQGTAYLKSPIQRQCPAIGKIAALGWRPTTGIAEGFRRTIEAALA
jgi:nucleoside-diphosphate-sugar epimerase